MYEKLSIEDFGRQLFETGDLDPVYPMLRKANMEPVQLRRWLLAYWCFYHAGVASLLSNMDSPEQYWKMFHHAVRNEPDDMIEVNGKMVRWPRSAERRHFRGDNAMKAYEWLSKRYPEPAGVCQEFEAAKQQTFKSIYTHVQKLPQFGPWIAFKVVDMLVNVLGVQIDLTGADLSIYDEPVKGAQLACEQWGITFATTHPGDVKKQAVEIALKRLAEALPTINDGRAISIATVLEWETVLCKFKAHLNGHYPVGKDTSEIKHGLRGWGATAERLADLL